LASRTPQGAHAADNLAAHLNGHEARPFAFAFTLRCISLGRGRGLIQWVGANDQPHERIITGRMGAVIKEMTCRYTRYSHGLERRWPGL
jgi:NADH dehydrogenase FAD-containing subunit